MYEMTIAYGTSAGLEALEGCATPSMLSVFKYNVNQCLIHLDLTIYSVEIYCLFTLSNV